MYQDSLSPSAEAVPTAGSGGATRTYRWNWKSRSVAIAYEVLGEGKPILLLPAFSSISSREEMRGLANILAQQFRITLLDWVGFGESDRPAFDYNPKLYHKCLRDFVRSMFAEPVVAIAAGHTAGYVMALAQEQPSPWSWIVLVAPTWRGPLPTMMGANRRGIFGLLRLLVRLPLLGQFLYSLNIKPGFLQWMMRRHVFADPAHISPEVMQQKIQTTRRKGARFASVAFVTGGLDPVRTRAEFMDYFHPMRVPTLVVIGEQTPPKSLEEMEILAHFSQVQSYRMPGTLGLHEEYPDRLAEAILPFLKKYLS